MQRRNGHFVCQLSLAGFLVIGAPSKVSVGLSCMQHMVGQQHTMFPHIIVRSREDLAFQDTSNSHFAPVTERM